MITKPHSPVNLGRYQIVLDGNRVTYTLRRSLRAKYARLEVGHDVGLAVVIPRSYEVGHVSSLLRKKKRWILEKLARLEHLAEVSPAPGLKPRDTIPYLGRELSVVRQPSHNGRDGVRLDGNELVVTAKTGDSQASLLMEAWYRIQAARLLRERVTDLSIRMGVTPGRMSIRGQKTRWGSCSGHGNLSFNWKLLMSPAPVIDYVVVHELAHLRELNHSKRFWRLLAEYCPEWREHKRWLREHETELADHFR